MELVAEPSKSSASHPIPSWLLSQTTKNQQEKLMSEQKVMLTDIVTPEGEVKTGKIQIVPYNDIYQIQFFEKRKKLAIPKEIDGEKLTHEQIHALRQGKFIRLRNGKYFKVDRKLNRVLLYTSKELAEVSHVGNYKLTKEDQLKLLNGQSISKVLHNPHKDNFILTTFKFNLEKKCIEFDNNKTKLLTNTKAKEQMKALNQLESIGDQRSPKELIREFLTGNDSVSVPLKKAFNEGFKMEIQDIMEVTNNLAHERAHGLLALLNQDTKSIERMQLLLSQQKVFDPQNDNELTITSYDLNKNQMTLQTKEGHRIETTLTHKLQTQDERKLHIQSMSMGISKSKGVSRGH